MPNKGSKRGPKQRTQEVPRFQVRVPRKGSGRFQVPSIRFQVKDQAGFKVPSKDSRVPSEGSRREFPSKGKISEGAKVPSKGPAQRFQDVARFQVRVPSEGSKRFQILCRLWKVPKFQVRVSSNRFEEFPRFQVRVPSTGLK